MEQIILGIDIGSSKICSLIADMRDGSPRILGVGLAQSNGIQKGSIKAIDSASKAVKESIDEAKRMAGIEVSRAYISLSGISTNSTNISEVVTLQANCEIGSKEINRIMQQAAFNAPRSVIPQNYELVHILPYSFKLDNREFIDDPFGMVGSRLDMCARVVYAHKSDLANLKKVVQNAGVEVAGIVLNAYASSIATLNDDEKELGVCCIDMGSDSCNFMVHRGNSMQYDDFVHAGSWNVTNDIATVLNTTLNVAELIKIEFAKLDELTQEDLEFTLTNVPTRSGEDRQIKYEVFHGIVSARVLDILNRIESSLIQSDFKNVLGAGVVITGGMSCMKGLKTMAQAVFGDVSVRIAEPKRINDSFDILKDKGIPYASFATAIGLILYASGKFTNYELDSAGKMQYKQNLQSNTKAISPDIKEKVNLEDIIKEEREKIEAITLDDGRKSIWEKFVNWLRNLF